MQSLLKQAASRGMLPAYVSRLITAFGAPDRGLPARPEAQPLVEPLSDRELEVLHALTEHLSNREISQRLFISLATVKSHTSSIYSKLGVHSRKEAVDRAQALGILPRP
jgi:LuxR family maltose regulon positive regulatory protein